MKIIMQPDHSLLLHDGLLVQIVTNNRTKTLFFSRAIRGVELTREQCNRLSEILTSRTEAPRPMVILRKLLREGYFETPKTLSLIRDELMSHSIQLRPSAVNVLLKEMSRRKELNRQGLKGAYEYTDPRGAMQRTPSILGNSGRKADSELLPKRLPIRLSQD